MTTATGRAPVRWFFYPAPHSRTSARQGFQGGPLPRAHPGTGDGPARDAGLPAPVCGSGAGGEGTTTHPNTTHAPSAHARGLPVNGRSPGASLHPAPLFPITVSITRSSQDVWKASEWNPGSDSSSAGPSRYSADRLFSQADSVPDVTTFGTIQPITKRTTPPQRRGARELSASMISRRLAHDRPRLEE